jgi:methyl-accepting chemotaxis protein
MFEEAEPYRELIDAHLLERGLTNDVVPLIQAANFFEFMRQVPAYLGKYCYFRGIYELNFRHDAANARAYFHTAHHICAIQESVTSCPGQFSLLARFHQGLALLSGGQQEEALDVFEELEKKSPQLSPNLLTRIRWEKAVARLSAGDHAAAIRQFLITAMEHFEFIKPSMCEPIQNILMAVAQRLHSVRAHIESQRSRIETMSSQIVGDLTNLKPQLISRLDRLDRLADRSTEVAGHVEAQIATSTKRLKDLVKHSTELGRDLRSRVQRGSARVGSLIEHGEGLVARLDSRVREGAEHVDALASRSLDLAQRIEKGLSRANDTSLRVQQFLERNQEPALEIAGRCKEVFTALEATAQSLQLAVDFIYRGLVRARLAITFPARVVRGAWRAIGLPSKRVSVRRIGMRHALKFEGRIPLGEIVAGIVIEQGVVAEQNGLSALALSFGICHRINRCTLQVSVVDDKGESIREAVVSCETLPDNRPYRFDFEPLADSEGKAYRVRITSSDAVAGNAVTVWSRLTDNPRGLTYNGKPIVDGELMAELCYS